MLTHESHSRCQRLALEFADTVPSTVLVRDEWTLLRVADASLSRKVLITK